jgi:hypothetical protein
LTNIKQSIVRKVTTEYRARLGIEIPKVIGITQTPIIENRNGNKIVEKIYSGVLTPVKINVLKFFLSFSSLIISVVKVPAVRL